MRDTPCVCTPDQRRANNDAQAGLAWVGTAVSKETYYSFKRDLPVYSSRLTGAASGGRKKLMGKAKQLMGKANAYTLNPKP
jgi:hypothetical protein